MSADPWRFKYLSRIRLVLPPVADGLQRLLASTPLVD